MRTVRPTRSITVRVWAETAAAAEKTTQTPQRTAGIVERKYEFFIVLRDGSALTTALSR
jgi:ketosteroid isomerase-like protein